MLRAYTAVLAAVLIATQSVALAFAPQIILIKKKAAPTTTTTVPAGQKPPDLAPTFDTVWDFENAGTIGENDSDTICGATCNVSTVPFSYDAMTQNTTNVLIGSGSGNRQVGAVDGAQMCVGATPSSSTCEVGSMDMNNVDYTRVCWVYNDGLHAAHQYLYWNKVSNDGIQVFWGLNTANDISWQSCDGTSCGWVTNNTSLTTGAWHHTAWSHSTAGTVSGYLDGNHDGDVTGLGAGYGNTTRNLEMSNGVSANWSGQMDECGYIKQILDEAMICHIAACGIDGQTGPCDCAGDGSYTDAGRHTSMSLPCTLATNGCLTAGGLVP